MPATRAARRAAARQQMAAGMQTYDGLGDDVQDCIVASMNVTSILRYGACSRAAQRAVNRWKARIATLAGLGGVAPSGARVRTALSHAIQRAGQPPDHETAVDHFVRTLRQNGLTERPIPADIMDFLGVDRFAVTTFCAIVFAREPGAAR